MTDGGTLEGAAADDAAPDGVASERPQPGASPLAERPERLLVAARLDGGDGGRYLFARWPDWPHPAMLSTPAPSDPGALHEVVQELLHARLGVVCAGALRASPQRVPVRMAHPRFGGEGVGWLRPVVVAVAADPQPQPDALLEGSEELTLEQALARLPTEVERIVLRMASDLLEDVS